MIRQIFVNTSTLVSTSNVFILAHVCTFDTEIGTNRNNNDRFEEGKKMLQDFGLQVHTQ